MNKKNYKLLLEWFEKDPGNKLISKEEIHITAEELTTLMRLDPKKNPFSGGAHPLKRKKEIMIIQGLVNHKINIEDYDYFVATVAVSLVPTINPLKHDIYINRNELMAHIDSYIPPTQKDIDKYGNELDYNYKSFIRLEKSARKIYVEVLEKLEKFYQPHGAYIGFDMKRYKSNPESIPYGVLRRLLNTTPEELTLESIEVIKTFLTTPTGKEMEAWEKWESYWKKIDE